MRLPNITALLLACLLSVPQTSPPSANAAAPTDRNDITVHFSPKGGCTDTIVREIDAAKSTLLIQA